MFYHKDLYIKKYQIYCKDNCRYLKIPARENIQFVENYCPEKKINKYYYLNTLYSFAHYRKEYVDKIVEIIQWIYKNTQRRYDDKIIKTLDNYCPIIENTHFAPFFAIIYLSMLDLEIGSSFPEGSGKTMVYKSCMAVLKENYAVETAANMFSKKIHNDNDETAGWDFGSYDEHQERTDSSYEDIVMNALENGEGEAFGF